MKNSVLTYCLIGCAACAGAASLPEIRIQDTGVYPESITSSADGAVFTGSMKGIIYRAAPGSAAAVPWITPNADNGLLTVFGVLADEGSGTLWACSVPNLFGPERSRGVSALVAFDLETGALQGRYDFPPPASVCNDITVGPDGTAYASDTGNGRLFALAPGADTLRLFGAAEALVGVDGLAFSADGTLYVNNVRGNQIFRVGISDAGGMGELTALRLSHELGGPDGFRLIEGNRFIQAEGTIGRLGVITIEGDSATLEVITDALQSSPGATVVGETAYVIESNIHYLQDPALQGQEPEAFMLHAYPLEQRQ